MSLTLPIRGLSAEQEAERRTAVGCSDLYKLMKGEWREVWEVKTGRSLGEDLSSNFRAQLGLYTEAFNRAWFEREARRQVLASGKTFRHPVVPLAWTADGQCLDPENVDALIPWEAKHCAHYDTIEGAAETYYAQLQGQMEVTSSSAAILSVIFGNRGLEWIRVEYDAGYVTKILRVVEEFWSYVEKDQHPPVKEAIATPAVIANVIYDFSMSNEFTTHAIEWTEHIDAHIRVENAEKAMKALTPQDATFVYHDLGICIARAKNGNLSLRVPTKKDIERIRKHQGTKDGKSGRS